MSKNILITGGTGFLGRHLGKVLDANYNVVLTGRNNKHNNYAEKLTGCRVMPLDITNIESVRDVFSEAKPQIVIHAAATKYVDLSEKYPMECLDVNITGSQNVARVAVEKGVDTVIGMSTDKSAPPVANTYGLTKALMERFLCSMDGKTETKFACVRHGNIAWSTGSFLPIWKRMLETNGVIGSTGPDMTRYLSTVEEASELVVTAIENIEEVRAGVLSREMKKVLIRKVADCWTKNRGGRWEQIEGRPGERPHEYLMGEPELPYTEKVEYDGIIHYLTVFNKLAEKPMENVRCSADAEHLSDEEMLEIIDNPPVEEI